MSIPRHARRARSDVMHRSPMGERRGWKFLGINVGSPKVDPNTVATKLTSKGVPVAQAQQVGNDMATDVNGAIDASNKGLGVGLGALGAGVGLGALGLGPFAGSAVAGGGGTSGGSSGGDNTTWTYGNSENPGDTSTTTTPDDGSGDSGFMNWAKGQLTGNGPGGSGASNLDKLLLGGSVVASAADQAYKQGLIKNAIDSSTSAYNANAPLRDQGRTLLQNRSLPDLSSVFSNPGNPYARRVQLPSVGGPSASPLPTSPSPGTALS